ncbi:MAG: sensor histidine kinase, partial [Caldilineae bacterium]
MSGRNKPASQPLSAAPLLHRRRYRALMWQAGLAIGLTAILPLLVMTWINYSQFEETFHQELIRPVARFTANAERSLEAFLRERISALDLVIRDKSISDLSDNMALARLLANMKEAFGGFVDLGLIDPEGNQVSYAGPYNLAGKNYAQQPWFHAVQLRGIYISDVFMGYRHLPHFVIAVRDDRPESDGWVLRATIDSEVVNDLILGMEPGGSSDVFLINRQGVLQTPSRRHGEILEKVRLTIPPYSRRPEVMETHDSQGQPIILGYAYVANSPFIILEVVQPATRQAGWLAMRRNLLLFLLGSILVVLGVVFYGTRYMVNRIRDVDMRRAAMFHKMEYTNKLAAIGRLSAGVAHEINNPLAIISEKAGLMKDLLEMSESPPDRERLLALVDSVLKSVERCSAITHRLLGFARHMDVQKDHINLELLLREVLSFLEKEAAYRNIEVSVEVAADVPNIESDRGQLQQVFLNIINNAFAAMESGGKLTLSVSRLDVDRVAVTIADTGTGIAPEHLPHIFEPFFTTKKGSGTGLG